MKLLKATSWVSIALLMVSVSGCVTVPPSYPYGYGYYQPGPYYYTPAPYYYPYYYGPSVRFGFFGGFRHR